MADILVQSHICTVLSCMRPACIKFNGVIYLVTFHYSQVNDIDLYNVQDWERVAEADVWHGLAQVYTQLKQWPDAETCLEKAQSIDSYSVATWHNTG